MLTTQISNAFKEWDIVVQALLSGKQTVILRKGGITEDKGTFSVDHTDFLLFPTFAHENQEHLTVGDLATPEDKRPDIVTISAFAHVEEVHFIEDLHKLKNIQPFTIWTKKYLEERFKWGDYKGIHMILTRVYELPEAIQIPMLKKYEGCKSWVEIEKSVSLEGSKAVLSDEAFQVQKEKIISALELKTEQNY